MVNDTLFFEPILSLYPNKATLTYQPVNGWRGKKKVSDESKANLKRREPLGLISKSVNKKIVNAIGWMHLFARNKKVKRDEKKGQFDFKLNMITLTLPSLQVHCDKVIKRVCLNDFLIMAKRKWSIENYIWRAETQQNGNIHFHIICDKFVNHQELRQSWNAIVNKLDYVNNSINTKNPNSTDIHSLKKVRNIAAYMAKYVGKNQKERRLIVGALWGCSDKIRGLKSVAVSCQGRIFDEIDKRVFSGEYKSFVKDKIYVVLEPIERLMSNIGGLRQKVIDYYNEKMLNLCTSKNEILENILCLKSEISLAPLAPKYLQERLSF